MAKSTTGLPGPLADGVRRFEKWRKTRTTRRIPAELWSVAAELGGEYGLSRVANGINLRLFTLTPFTGGTPLRFWLVGSPRM